MEAPRSRRPSRRCGAAERSQQRSGAFPASAVLMTPQALKVLIRS